MSKPLRLDDGAIEELEAAATWYEAHRRFPYSVVFVELDTEIRVVSIAHTSREPGFWRSRL